MADKTDDLHAPQQSDEQEPEWIQAAKQAPLINDPLPVGCLREEYAGNANGNFLHGIRFLETQYTSMRRVRGDGNCFFRAFIFALCEQLCGEQAKSPRALRIRETIAASKDELVALGYNEMAIETFWETFVDYLAAMETRSHAELVQDFQTEGGEAEYLVWYMRLLTAGRIKKYADMYQPYIDGLYPGQSIAQFCASEVEPMGKECDEPQITALTDALSVDVTIEYLDGSTTSPDQRLQNCRYTSSMTAPIAMVDTAQQKKLKAETIYLLYRPGHYDILYPKSE